MDELKLNTLHRFQKHSPELTLEQHTSCEVPAGCGGVALRWIHPAQEAYVHFTFYTPGEGKLYLDGQPIHSTVFSLRKGPHVLALHLSKGASFVLAAQRDPEPKPKLLFVSQADGSWSATDSQPDDSWTALDFSALWPKLEAMTPEPASARPWWQARAEKMGADLLGIQGATQLWVRKVFEL